jgi:carboxylesterase type B
MPMTEDVVELPSGAFVQGQHSRHGRSFKGIPYATASRWTPPRPYHITSPSSSPFKADKWGDRCPQLPDFENPLFYVDKIAHLATSSSEDCLSLSILTPRLNKIHGSLGGTLPVMVWFHGTIFPTGETSWIRENGKRFIQQSNGSLSASNVILLSVSNMAS